MTRETLQSPADVWHLPHPADDLRTACGIDLDRPTRDARRDWHVAPGSFWEAPPWGRRCRRCEWPAAGRGEEAGS